MDTLSYKTQVAKPSTVVHKWYIVDAENQTLGRICLLYTSDAADERSSVDLGGRRIIKKKTNRE